MPDVIRRLSSQFLGNWLPVSPITRAMALCSSKEAAAGACGIRPAHTEEQKQKLKARLSPEAYVITQEGGTERPFTGKYNKHYEKGLYKCIVCEQSLFPSMSKFDSGTGWPSFWKPLSKESVKELVDKKHGMVRTEVLCGRCAAHLGHVFNDGPKDKTGLRYCINSASLEFQAE